MGESRHLTIEGEGAVPIKAWVRGVPFEDEARQLENVARLPIVHRWVAAMPDVHWGIGATVGSVIPTKGAIIPAAVGVDIGCGMMTVRTSLRAADLPDSLAGVRRAIEAAVPHGFAKGRQRDRGAWHDPPAHADEEWGRLAAGFERIAAKHPAVRRSNHRVHMGTLGSGNHFIEICLDEEDAVWIMLHSGSRGVGNRIGTYFIGLAREDMRSHWENLPDQPGVGRCLSGVERRTKRLVVRERVRLERREPAHPLRPRTRRLARDGRRGEMALGITLPAQVSPVLVQQEQTAPTKVSLDPNNAAFEYLPHLASLEMSEPLPDELAILLVVGAVESDHVEMWVQPKIRRRSLCGADRAGLRPL